MVFHCGQRLRSSCPVPQKLLNLIEDGRNGIGCAHNSRVDGIQQIRSDVTFGVVWGTGTNVAPYPPHNSLLNVAGKMVEDSRCRTPDTIFSIVKF